MRNVYGRNQENRREVKTMEVVVLVEVDEALQYARQKLGAMQKKAPQAVRTALNKTAREAKKQDERITKQTYTAKGDIHSLQFKKATTANLQAILKDKGSNISMSHFRTYVGKKRISAVINTKHGRRNLGKYGNKAFFWNTIFVREGQSRLPIEKMASISSPVMHGNVNTWGTIEDDVRSKLYENIDKEIERILGL